MAIDDPLEKIRQLAKDRDFDGIGASLQAGAIFSPVFKVFSVAKGIADSYKKGEKVTIAIHALCDELQRIQDQWPKDLESAFETDAFTLRFDEFKRRTAALGIDPDDNVSLGARLSGFGLAYEAPRNTTRQSPVEHCFRPTKRGLYLLALLEAAEHSAEKHN
jgi:hypothetical protein